MNASARIHTQPGVMALAKHLSDRADGWDAMVADVDAQADAIRARWAANAARYLAAIPPPADDAVAIESIMS